MSIETNLVLVRHGASRATELQMVGGHLGCRGLSVEGVSQAEKLARRWLKVPPFSPEFPYGAGYSSVMRRSVETATAVLSPLGLTLDAQLCDLCEIHPGDADGLTWDEFGKKYPEIDIYSDPDLPLAPNGESWNQMRARTITALGAIVDRHPQQTVLVFTHKGVVDAVLEGWFGVSPKCTTVGSNNTGITTVRLRREKRGHFAPLLISYNDAAHIFS